MKRLAFVLLFAASALRTFADTEVVDGVEWTYTISGGTASVGGGMSSSPAVPSTMTGAVAIPTTLGGYTVTSIGGYAFYNCSGLTSITIPDGVESIGYLAFRFCSGLTSITIPDGVTRIEPETFWGCSGLETVVIPKSVTTISGSAFASCSRLMSFSVAADNPVFMSANGCLLTKDGRTFFHGINESVAAIPNGVTRIESGAFYGCTNLTSVLIPDSLTSIGRSAFRYCSNLASIDIPDSVTSIGDYVFFSCPSLMSITIPYAYSSEIDEWGLPEGCHIEFGDRKSLIISTNPELPSARAGFQYLARLEMAGGKRPYSLELVNTADNMSWLTAHDSRIEVDNDQYDFWLDGTPCVSDIGTHSFTLRVTDAEGSSTQSVFTIVVRPGIEWTPKASRFRIEPGAITNLSGIVSNPAQDLFSFEWGLQTFHHNQDEEWWGWNDLECSLNSFAFDSSVYGEGKYRITGYANDGTNSTLHSWFVTVAPKTNLVIETDATLPVARVGQSYWQELVISGGEEPYSVEILDRDDWPDWLWVVGAGSDYYLNPFLQGSPDDSDIGGHSFTLRVTDAEGTNVEKRFTLVVKRNERPVIETWTPATRRFRIDPETTTNFTVVASDPDGDELWFYWDIYKQAEGGWSWIDKIESSMGLFAFNSAEYGSGRYRIECIASDGWSFDWQSWIVTVAVQSPLSFSTDSILSDARAGNYRQAIKIAGGEEPYTVEIVNPDTWPPWLDSDYIDHWDDWGGDDPVLQGHPDNDDVGTYSFVLRVTDVEGTSVERTFTVAVVSNSPPVIGSWTPQTSRFRIDPGAVTNFSVAASDSDGDDLSFRWRVYRQSSSFWAWEYWEDGSDSDRFTFRSSRYDEGLYRIEAEVDDGAYSEQHTWIVSVARDKPLAIITGQSLPSGKAYWSYSQELRIAGGSEPYVVGIVDRDTGSNWLYVDWWQDPWENVCYYLRGLPYSYDVGTHSFTLRVTDAEGRTVEKTFTLVVEPNSEPVIQSWTPTGARFRMDSGATTNFSVTAFDPDGDELSYDWYVYKKTADGWDLVADAVEEDHFFFDSFRFGDGRYQVNVYVSDGGVSQDQSWTFTVGPKTPLSFETSAALPSAKAGWSYWQEVEISGGEEPYTVEIVNPDTWPDWLNSDYVGYWDEWEYDNPVLHGWPNNDDVGTNSFVLRVADAEGTSISNTFTIVVESNSPPVFESWTPETTIFRMDPGSTTNLTVVVSDPDGDDLSMYWYIFRLTEDGTKRLYGGYGSETFAFRSSDFGEGEYLLEVSASDGGYSDFRSWVVYVAEKTPLTIATDGSLPPARTGQYYQQKLTISGGEHPYTNNVVLPDWLRFDEGYLFGYPDFRDGVVVGTNSFTLRVTDAEGTTVEKTFTLEVEAWTMYTPEPVPHAWLDRYYSNLISWIDYEDCGFSGASNGGSWVWQCYVAGLDPTNAASRFVATIGFDEEGTPDIGWSPELSDEEAAKRTYTILGKTSLTNENWSVVAPGTEANYNFFSVSVEMK